MKNRQRNLNYNFQLQTVYKWWLINRNYNVRQTLINLSQYYDYYFWKQQSIHMLYHTVRLLIVYNALNLKGMYFFPLIIIAVFETPLWLISTVRREVFSSLRSRRSDFSTTTMLFTSIVSCQLVTEIHQTPGKITKSFPFVRFRHVQSIGREQTPRLPSVKVGEGNFYRGDGWVCTQARTLW